jgi:catechol 2,3-dioxygenase-like lactoylglutathione lyase family enzyme
MSAWAELRQVVLATTDPATVAGGLRSWLRLGDGFGDPELDAFGIADDTMAVGEHTYLEVVSPTTAEHPMATLLTRRGGSMGYLLSVQVGDLPACLERVAAEGVRVTVRHVVQGWDVVQLHPADVGGSTIELDGLHERGRWFWDRLDVDRRVEALVDDVVAVEIGCADPAAMAARWARLLGLAVTRRSDELALADRLVRFVPADAGSGVVAVDLHARERSDAGVERSIGQVRFRLV